MSKQSKWLPWSCWCRCGIPVDRMFHKNRGATFLLIASSTSVHWVHESMSIACMPPDTTCNSSQRVEARRVSAVAAVVPCDLLIRLQSRCKPEARAADAQCFIKTAAGLFTYKSKCVRLNQESRMLKKN